ncbi:hypothetical protein [Sphingobium yanoikuyae]|uniref:hypothetical protein n=1 Tax=Sphingobium yanoikuyae TaxID=13690 RepID=UPI00242D0CD9|nr:hypothetical protein [Sphingobium yanoikuyae]
MSNTITMGAIAFAIGGIALRWRFPAVPQVLATSLFVGSAVIAAGEASFSNVLPALPARTILFSLALNAATLAALVDLWFTKKSPIKSMIEAKPKGLTSGERKSLQRAFAQQSGKVAICFDFDSAIDAVEEIDGIFQAQGWQTSVARGGGFFGIPDPTKPIRLIYQKGNAAALSVKSGFAEAGIEFEIFEYDHLTSDIEIEVSRFFADRS